MAVLPSLWWAAAALPPLALAWWRPGWLVLVFFVCGVAWASLRAGWILGDMLPAELEGQNLDVVGWVADIPQVTEYGHRFLFDIDAAQQDNTQVVAPRRVQLNSTAENFTPRAGE